MIILNEKQYVEENCLKQGYTLKTFDDVYMMIRYYISKNMSIAEIHDEMNKMNISHVIEDCIKSDHVFTAFYMKAKERPIRDGSPIPITKYEYDFVRRVENVELEKILFTMLVIQKMMDKSAFKMTFSDIKKMSMTKIDSDSIKFAVRDLEAAGFITIISWRNYKVNINNFEVMKSDKYIEIDNFNRIPAPYLRTLRTEKYFYCEKCGKKTSFEDKDNRNNRLRKYCDKCGLKLKNASKKERKK